MNQRRKRRRYTAEEKKAVLKKHLMDQVPVSELCEAEGIQPSVFYGWQRAVFENLDVALEASDGRRQRKENGVAARLQRENEALKAKLARKDAVIAEIAEEHVALKKNLGSSERPLGSP